jgi:iron(III) transport system substrate-binding protein
MRGRIRFLGAAMVAALLLVSAACGGGNSGSQGSSSKSMTLYTCVDDTTIGAVVKAFTRLHPGTDIKLYRAPTGDLNARVAGDVRSGGLRADAIWGCDPLTMQDWTNQHLVGGWTPTTNIPAQYRTSNYVGVAILYIVAVTGKGVPAPTSWSDLTSSTYGGKVAIPDPSLAASALGALGYFAADPRYGTRFYADLKKAGATQVSTPDDVVSGVAEGTYKAGITIANSAYVAKQGGSPITVTWPQPGSISIYGPIALAKNSKHRELAQSFISYVTSRPGQRVIGKAGSYPTLPGVPGPPKPAGAPVVTPDWKKISAHKDALLATYQKIFGGG